MSKTREDDEEFGEEIEKCCNLGQTDIINVPITEYEMERCLSKTKDKMPGPDMITNKMIKNCHYKYKEELLSIFNQSLLSGEVPGGWKLGYVSMILKPSKPRENCSSYRPITLLSCIGKLMERIIKSRIEHHLEIKQLLSPNQYGFRPSRSTEDIISLVTNKVNAAVHNKEICLILYIDLKGAFDKVWRQGALLKMAKLGVHGNVLSWLRSYFDQRTQSVVIHGNLSEKMNIDVGVPQGGVLSPLLFNVMLQDIPTNPNSKTYIFADDITIVCSGPDIQRLASDMQSHLDDLQKWIRDWGLMINPH